MNQNAILIVEDDLSNRQFLEAFVRLSGYPVLTADDAQAGLDCIRRDHPALVLLDIRMPGIDGLEMVRIVRHEPEIATTPMVAITANVMPGVEQEILAAGCDGYLAKPVNINQLEEIIRQYVGAAI